MLVKIIERNYNDNCHHVKMRSHILSSPLVTYCGLKDFDGCGEYKELSEVVNLCKACLRISGAK